MLFIVPDTPLPESENDIPAGTRTPEEAEQQPTAKVELDLEGAPFLSEKTEPAAQPEIDSAPLSLEPDDAEGAEVSSTARLSKKKKILVGASILLFLILSAGAAFLFSSPALKPASELPTAISQGPKIIVVPKHSNGTTNATLPYAALIEWEPFMVPVKDTEGTVRIFTCTLSIPLEGRNTESLLAELLSKKVLLRDAVYYYLSRKPDTTVTDETAQKRLKDDLVSVINEHLTADKIREVYVQEYVVEGP